jgi:hypothetical protein
MTLLQKGRAIAVIAGLDEEEGRTALILADFGVSSFPPVSRLKCSGFW